MRTKEAYLLGAVLMVMAFAVFVSLVSLNFYMCLSLNENYKIDNMYYFSVSLTCGGIGKENTTYFESSGTEVGQCRVKICKCQPNVCQIRLDFNTFVIAGPSTSVSTVGLATFGVLEVGGAKGVSTATQCLTDMFSVTNPNGAAPPVICGTNTGEHMVIPESITHVLFLRAVKKSLFS